MKLPHPAFKGSLSLEEAIRQRRTIRNFAKRALSLEQVSQLLWASYGITKGFRRTVPSAGALYPMDIYPIVGAVDGIEKGVYHYIPEKHEVLLILEGDIRDEIAKASLYQMWMADASVLFLITAEYRRITIKYGERGVRYAVMEAGHIAQNLFLQSESLGLGAGIVGAFHDEKIIKLTGIPVAHHPVLIMPVGYKNP